MQVNSIRIETSLFQLNCPLIMINMENRSTSNLTRTLLINTNTNYLRYAGSLSQKLVRKWPGLLSPEESDYA